MAIFPRPAKPKVLLADIKAMFGQDRRHKLIFGALAIGVTSGIITLFILDARTNVMPGAQMVYAADWSENRSDAEIQAQQKIDQKEIDAARAERRRQFQKVDESMKRWGF